MIIKVYENWKEKPNENNNFHEFISDSNDGDDDDDEERICLRYLTRSRAVWICLWVRVQLQLIWFTLRFTLTRSVQRLSSLSARDRRLCIYSAHCRYYSIRFHYFYTSETKYLHPFRVLFIVFMIFSVVSCVSKENFLLRVLIFQSKFQFLSLSWWH